MSQFIGRQRAAQDLQAPAIGHHLQRPVVDDADDLRDDQDPQPCLKAAAGAAARERPDR